MVTIKDLEKEIKKQYRGIKKGKRYNYNFLGYVEDKDLSPEVENLFRVITPAGYTFYNWISGTETLKKFIKGITEEKQVE